MSNKVYIGAFLINNLGDDLFLKVLLEKYPSCSFIVDMDKQYRSPFIKYNNIDFVKHFWGESFLNRLTYKLFHFKLLDLIRRKSASAVIDIGGSLFIEQDGWQKACDCRVIQLNKNNVFVGCNFGPYINTEFVEKYKSFFKKCSFISWRDKYSYELFNMNNMQYAPDFVFNLKINQAVQSEVGRVLIIPADVRNVVGLSYNHEAYIKKMAELAKYCVDRGYKVELMAFCKTFHDDNACYAIYECLNEEQKMGVDIYIYENDMDEAIDHIQRAEYVIPTRFHGMILAWCCQRKVFPIVYTKKQRDEMKMLCYGGQYALIENISEYDVESVLLQGAQLSGVENVKEEAKLHFAAIERVI